MLAGARSGTVRRGSGWSNVWARIRVSHCQCLYQRQIWVATKWRSLDSGSWMAPSSHLKSQDHAALVSTQLSLLIHSEHVVWPDACWPRCSGLDALQRIGKSQGPKSRLLSNRGVIFDSPERIKRQGRLHFFSSPCRPSHAPFYSNCSFIFNLI